MGPIGFLKLEVGVIPIPGGCEASEPHTCRCSGLVGTELWQPRGLGGLRGPLLHPPDVISGPCLPRGFILGGEGES